MAVCPTAGCFGTTTKGGPCRDCQTVRQRRRRARERNLGRERRVSERLRATILRRDPFCAVCGTEPSEDVDHVVGLADGGTNDPANLQGICACCHSEKTTRAHEERMHPAGPSAFSDLAALDRRGMPENKRATSPGDLA